MKLAISYAVYNDMVTAARETKPIEACGLLGGRDERATQCYRLTNADASADHFSMKPEEQFTAIKDMRARGLQMLAIWHSHPITPARMSDEDLRLAFTPDVTYVIVSLASGSGPAIRGFQVVDGQTVEIEVVMDHE